MNLVREWVEVSDTWMYAGRRVASNTSIELFTNLALVL